MPKTSPPRPSVPIPGDSALADNACWIWARGADGPNCYAEFRRAFELNAAPARASIQLSAETSLRLWVNGRLIHSGPLREIAPRFYFDTIDLTPHLRTGPNVILIVAHHQGINSQSYQAGTPAILVAGRVEYEIDFCEPSKWEARPITRYLADAHRLFHCIGFSEHVDFNTPEAAWNPAAEVARHPWPERPKALPRDLPAFAVSECLPRDVTAREGGWLVDFGTEVSGYIELNFQARRHFTLRASYGEELVEGKVHPEKAGMAYYDVLEVPVGPVTWRSYEKRAFRYLQLSEPIEAVELKVVEENFPYEAKYARTESYQKNTKSEEGRLINRILDVSARTIALNSEDLLTDCPWRERAQYFDCYFYMEAMQQLFGTLEPIRRFLIQFPRGADATGLLRCCYPSPGSMAIIPDFSISYAIHLHRYLELSGDLETVRHNLIFAERGVIAFQPHEDSAGLLTEVPGWIFIDNTFELPKFPRSAALNAVYYGGHRAVAELLRACGEEKRAREFETRAVRLRAAFRKAFVQEDRVLDSDSTLAHESLRHWIYHFSAETGRWEGKSFRLRTRFRIADPATRLLLAVHADARVWIDGKSAAQIEAGDSWTRSAVYRPVELKTPHDDHWHQLDLEVQWNNIDWECYLSCAGDIEWEPLSVWEEPEFGACRPDQAPSETAFASRLRNQSPPWMTQATVGHAAFHGLLEPEEARRFLRDCLPAAYPFPFAKRTTPFFARIDDAPDLRRILPCNVPASMFHFCHALRRHGMEAEALALLLPIYRGMLERGATTWWEEWNTRSSLCHAWASFAATFLHTAG